MPVLQGFPGGSVVKNQPANAETQVLSLGREGPMEEEMATHSSIRPWRMTWTEELCGLHPRGQSIQLHRVGHH